MKKNHPDGLILTVLLAVVSAIGFNYALHKLDSEGFWDKTEKEEERFFCVVIESDENLAFSSMLGDSAYLANQNMVNKGISVFENNCQQCHSIHERVVGPALKNVHERWKSERQLYRFIRNPQQIIDSKKNPYAVALYEKYRQYMPSHDFLTDEELEGLLLYIKLMSKA